MSNVVIKPVWRWGEWTPWLATVFFLALGSLIVALAYGQGEHFFHSYTICLGYFVAWGIAQSHYFKVGQDTPYAKGLIIYPLIIILSILSYYLGNWIFTAVNAPVTFGHFTFIMLGFFIFGLDDFIFGGRLSKWLGSDFLRFLFWFLVIVVIWIFLLSFVLKEETQFRQFFGMFQWPIVCLLFYALLVRVRGKKLGFLRQSINFILLFVIGFFIAYLLNGHFSWHQVLDLGTFPLLSIIMLGLYFKGGSEPTFFVPDPPLRFLWVVFYSSLQVGLFTILLSLGLLGKVESFDATALQWCFTVAILPLAHYWFTGYWRFKKVATQ